MNYNLERLWVLCLVPLLKGSQNISHFCHDVLASPGTELICSGFTGLLRLKTYPFKNLRQLSFSNNKVSEIDSSSFNQNLSSVAYVYFDNNNLTHVTADAFKNMPKLKELDLSNNKIQTISPDLFVANADLKTVDLSGNQIRVLDVNSIDRLSRLKEFILSNNPLDVCDKKTNKTLRYLKQKNIKTNFLQTCDVRVDNNTNRKKSAAPFVEKSPQRLATLISISFVLLLLAIALTLLVTILCSMVRKQGDAETKKFMDLTSINSGEDSYGYLRPIIPANIPQYAEVIGDSQQSLLVSIHLENEIGTSGYHKNIVAYASAPILNPNDVSLPPVDHSTNQNLYEEIQ